MTFLLGTAPDLLRCPRERERDEIDERSVSHKEGLGEFVTGRGDGYFQPVILGGADQETNFRAFQRVPSGEHYATGGSGRDPGDARQRRRSIAYLAPLPTPARRAR